MRDPREALSAVLAEQSPDDDDLRDWLTDRAAFVLDALEAEGYRIVGEGQACIGGEVVTLRHRVVAVDSDAAGCSTSYCAGSNGFSGPEYPTCDGCNADGTRTVLLAEEAAS